MAINKTPIFVAKMRNYDIFVTKIYDYALIDSFLGFPGLIDSPTSYATLDINKSIYLWVSAEITPVCEPQTWQPGQDGEGQDLGKMGREAKLPDINFSNLADWLITIALVEAKH